MKKALALAALGLSMMSSNALAGEHRGGDAALGALSGAVVFGPVGALAGALVGFTAGPGIAQSWGLRRASTARRARRSAGQEAELDPLHACDRAAAKAERDWGLPLGLLAAIGLLYYLLVGRTKAFAPVTAPAGDDPPLVAGPAPQAGA